jgi:SAM-dependent methyltransferase
MVDRILEASRGTLILDVGAGTGISARPFTEAGCQVLGIEPDGAMAEIARGQGLEIEVATFEDWDPTGRTFDAVIAGQAWHWVDPLIGARKSAEILRPRGQLAVFWNVFEVPRDLAQPFAAAYDRVLPGSPFSRMALPGLEAYSSVLARTEKGIEDTGAFGRPEQWRFEWSRSYSRVEWLEQVPTFGGHAQLPRERLEDLLAGMGEAIDDRGGTFTMGYTTVVIRAPLSR